MLAVASTCGIVEASSARVPWPMPRHLVLLVGAIVLLAGACGDDDSTGSASGAAVTGERIELDGSAALIWGDGERGAVLAHGASYDAASWQEQAEQTAAAGSTVVAVEDLGPDALRAASEFLETERLVTDVAVLGAGAGADAMLALLSEEPDLADQVILLSPNRVVEGLGSQPKLFIASEGESVADVSRQLAEEAPGKQNDVLLVEGSAHAQGLFDSDQATVVTDAILERLA